jgi:ribosomal protein L44E
MAKGTKDNEFAVGKEILSYCGKCKKPTDHIIISLNKKEGPDKCECTKCKAKHKYRDPDKPVKKRATKPRKATVTNEAKWNEALTTAEGPSKPYAMSGEFELGDLLEHSKFGKGVVQELIGHNKIKVIFEESEKILIQKQ